MDATHLGRGAHNRLAIHAERDRRRFGAVTPTAPPASTSSRKQPQKQQRDQSASLADVNAI